MNKPESTEASDITLWKTCANCNLFLDACTCSGEDKAKSFGLTEEQTILPAGEVIGGHYQVIKLLGSGGMSSVYLCRHMLTDDLVAIKMLNLETALDDEARKRFDREAMTMASLFHDNLVGLKGHGYIGSGQTYFVMDFLDGKPLSVVLSKERALEPTRAVKIFLQICKAMSHAHSAGIVHRDLKPGNIFILEGRDGADFVKVLDFGIAKFDRSPGESTATLTQRGQVLGSPRYMSPEQCLGAPLDNRTDIYSLGCVMYQVLTGMPPFNGEHSLAILYKQVNEAACSMQDDGISPQLDDIIMRTLQKAPQDRYQSMDLLAADLRDWLKESGHAEH